MKVTPEMLEAALRRKRLAAGELAGPAKRGRREGRGGAAAALADTGASSSVVEPAREGRAGGVAPSSAEVEAEEGEIRVGGEMVLVDLDPEDETRAAAEPAGAEGAEAANDPPAVTESGAGRTCPPVEAEAREAERPGAETVGSEGAVAERGRRDMARVAGAMTEKGRPGKTQAEAERGRQAGARAEKERPGKTQAEAGRRPAEARRSGRRVAEAEGSSRRSSHRSAQPPSDEVPGGPPRPPPQLSSMSDAGVASHLLARTRTAASIAEVRGQTPAALLDVAVVNTLQLANVIFGLEGSLATSAETMSRVLARLESHKAQNRSLSEELARLRDDSKTREDEGKAREEALMGRVREAECQAQIEGVRASAAETKSTLLAARLEAFDLRIGDLVGQVRHLEGRLAETREEIRVAVEKTAAAEEAAIAADGERAKEAARAAEAEVRAAKAEARAAEADARAERAESRALEAEGKVREAELRVTAAVAEYKASADFVSEVVEASLGAYTVGFDLCKAKVSATFNLSGPDLDLIQAGEVSEERAAEDGEAERAAAVDGEAEEAGEHPGPSGV